MSDSIQELPVDTHTNVDISDTTRLQPFVKQESKSCLSETKKLIIIVSIFFVLSIPFVNSLFTSISDNAIILLLLKTLIFAGLLFVTMKLI